MHCCSLTLCESDETTARATRSLFWRVTLHGIHGIKAADGPVTPCRRSNGGNWLPVGLYTEGVYGGACRATFTPVVWWSGNRLQPDVSVEHRSIDGSDVGCLWRRDHLEHHQPCSGHAAADMALNRTWIAAYWLFLTYRMGTQTNAYVWFGFSTWHKGHLDNSQYVYCSSPFLSNNRRCNIHWFGIVLYPSFSCGVFNFGLFLLARW